MTLLWIGHDTVEWMFMKQSKSNVKGELTELKKQLDFLKNKELEMEHLITEKNMTEKVNTNMLELFRFMMAESKATKLLLQDVSAKLQRLEEELNTEYVEEPMTSDELQPFEAREVPISIVDKTVLQYIQGKEMVCATDLQKAMNYKGKNAASARLTRLSKLGLVKRYQLGHKVYYKFTAGKLTGSTLIVSPPQ